MTAAEQGLLLLCCRLEDDILPLTMGQYKRLRQLVREHHSQGGGEQELTAADLTAMGCSEAESERILTLLGRKESLQRRLDRWRRQGVEICTRLSPDYPQQFRERLGDDAPPVLFLLGDRSLLTREMAGVVGSRELTPAGADFAAAVGMAAAQKGVTLVSGNARGADKTAQDACLRAGGTVIAIVADQLANHKKQNGILYLSEEVPERGFSAVRALRRNRLIHAAGRCTFAAQVRNGSGGTWDGAVRNLQGGWTPLYVHADGSAGAAALCRLGASCVTANNVQKLI